MEIFDFKKKDTYDKQINVSDTAFTTKKSSLYNKMVNMLKGSDLIDNSLKMENGNWENMNFLEQMDSIQQVRFAFKLKVMSEVLVVANVTEDHGKLTEVHQQQVQDQLQPPPMDTHILMFLVDPKHGLQWLSIIFHVHKKILLSSPAGELFFCIYSCK